MKNGLNAARISLLITALAAPPALSQTSEDGFGVSWGGEAAICHNDGDEAKVRDDSYARSVIWDKMVLGEAYGECGAQPAPMVIDAELRAIDGGTWGLSEPFTGTDAEGREATFRLYVLNSRYSWVFDSAAAIEDEGRRADLAEILNTPEFRQRFCEGKAAFSVGAASFEGATDRNHRLAGARAETITQNLYGTRATCPEGRIPLLFNLNVGENQEQVPQSSIQRRVVLVVAEKIAIDVNLEQALRNALDRQNVFREVSLAEYDLFDLEAR
jgi:hypothetical protein